MKFSLLYIPHLRPAGSSSLGAYGMACPLARTLEQKRFLADLALVCNFKDTSDLPQWLIADEREDLRVFLEAEPKIARTGRYKFTIDDREVDFSPGISLPPPPRGLTSLGSAILGWLGNQHWALQIMHRLGVREQQKLKESL